MMKSSAFLPPVAVLAFTSGLAPGASAQALSVPDICYSDAASCRNVKVTVQGNQVAVDPASATVTGRATPVVIVWYMATPGYKFAASPVAFPNDYRASS
jgi:hypothetical protein